jgi:hypothetical protein
MNYRALFLSLIASLFFIWAAVPALAAGLTLSVSGDEDTARFNISGVPDASVTLHYVNDRDDDRTLRLGTADQDGYLSKSVDADEYDIDTDSTVYVTAGSQTSRTVSWPQSVASTGADFELAIDTVSVVPGKTTVVPVSDLGKGSLTVSGAKSSIAKVSVNGAQISVTGVAAGTTSTTVCLKGSSNCSLLTITVGGGTTTSFALSNMAPIVATDSTLTLVVTGASSGSFYVSDNSNPRAVQASVKNNTVVLEGNRVGTADISLCKSSSACVTFTATVIDKDDAEDGPVFVPSSLALSVGQTGKVSVGGIGGYSMTGSGHTSVFDATLGGGVLTIKGTDVGSRSVEVCDSEDNCSTLDVTVKDVAPPASPSSGSTSSAAPYRFTSFLEYGDNNTEVLALQLYLSATGYMTATPNGNFGPATEAAVKAFQAKHGIEAVGYVGPATRAALNGG